MVGASHLSRVDISLGQTFNVKKLLLDWEWITASRTGFSLVQPEALLREWSENYDLMFLPRMSVFH